MSLPSQIFGLAATTTYVASENLGLNNISGILQQMALAFNGTPSDGLYIYNLFSGLTGLSTTEGFDASSPSWSNLTGAVYQYESYPPSTVGISALIYAFATYPSLLTPYQTYYINKYNSNIYQLFFGNLALPKTIFTNSLVNNLVYGVQLNQLNEDIATSPSNTYNKMVNYNWYNALPLFVNPSNLSQLIKDIEIQYYYLSGELVYNPLPTGLLPCVQKNININTPTGIIQSTYIENIPCYDNQSYIGPISGVKFLRSFCDGPPTSGYFDSITTAEYINFDEAVLSPLDYSSNNVILYNYDLDVSGNYILLYSGISIDIPGLYNPNAEYGYGHTNYISSDLGCSWGSPPIYNDSNDNPLPYMSMHEGDNYLKWWFNMHCVSYSLETCDDCVVTSGQYNWTGWKLTDFELDQSLLSNFIFIQNNPIENPNRLLKRALNIDTSSPYLEVSDTGDGVLSCLNYVGPPQLDGNSSLPGFVFYQTFDNQHFPAGGSNASVVIRPSISTSSQGNVNSLSNRDFSANISEFNILSGKYSSHPNLTQKLQISLSNTLNSVQMQNYDQVFQECLAIGDGFSGGVDFTGGQESNAGFVYTNFIYAISGSGISQFDLLQDFPVQTIGSDYQLIKYITGYKNNHGIIFDVTTRSAQLIDSSQITGINYTGEQISYYYFPNNATLGSTNSGWNSFAPIPTDVVNNPQNYQPLFAYQTVENYIPRYTKGPFLTYDSNFLYPNAASVSSIYSSSSKGFPTGFSYVIKVKEETVKEAYLASGFNNFLIPINIIRGSGNGLFNLNTPMEIPFIASNSIYKFTYDFNNNSLLYPDNGSFGNVGVIGSYVNGNYVPSIQNCPQLSLNNSIMDDSFGVFDCGVRITGQFVNRTILTGINQTKTIYSPIPLINGLYWGYNGFVRSGTVAYVPPIFDLSTKSLNVTTELTAALYPEGVATSTAFSNNGSLRYADLIDSTSNYNGKDPIAYEYVGGRSGTTANQEGGYNSIGIIGDNWYDFTVGTWGQILQFCQGISYPYRFPEADNNLLLLAFNATGLNIYTRGMQYNPYYLNWNYQPYTTQSSLNIGISGQKNVKIANEYYFNFNLKDSFPIKTTFGGFYSTGLNIGPFPIDSELCITGGCQIIPVGDFYIDGEMIASSNPANYGTCVLNPIEGFLLNSGIILGQGGRSSVLSTFKLIPSGATININLSGEPGLIGFTGDSVVTIRPRTVCAQIANGYNGQGGDLNLLSGDQNIMDNFRYIDNGSEKVYSIPNNGKFENLIGTPYVKETQVNSEILYPLPDTDFNTILSGNGLLTTDKFGNLIYNLSNGGPTAQYWKIKTPNALFTGFREISRISFEITQLTAQYGPIPYQALQTLIPSGTCTVNATFGYSGEAESAIITEGIILTGIVFPSLNSGILEPIYISDVLQRLPSGIKILPSGSGIYPVLSAPSLMEERLNPFVITGNDKYIAVTPTGTNYNRFLWPALSDFATFNPTLTYEQVPPDDGSVFLTDTLTFSASQGQRIISGVNNLTENVIYQVINEYMFLDSVATNALYNTGNCLITTLPSNPFLNSGNLTGLLSPEGASLTLALAI